MEKDFSTVSPSAISLLLLKCHTNIPFAKQAATLVFGAEIVAASAEKLQNPTVVSRLSHFENRYNTIDKALQDTGITNVIELSSGFSFRGLQLCTNADIYYIDTDLPNIVATKTDLLSSIMPNLPANYVLAPLNVLNADAFLNITQALPPGKLAIINEGLLVYLNLEEKQRLCGIIHSILKARGGCWITGDVYIRNSSKVEHAEQTQKFLDAHNVEENKFADFNDAERFFERCGFAIIERLIKPWQPYTNRQYFGSQGAADTAGGTDKHIRETWVLSAV